MDTNSGKKGAYRPPTAERKLEKQLTSLKKQLHSLSADPQPWEVKEHPKLGDYFVVLMGGSGAGEYVQHSVLHRRIGQDYTIRPEDDWVISNSADIPGFYSQEKFPGEKKVLERLRNLQSRYAVEAGTVTLDGKDEVYPNGEYRKEVHDLARDASAIHAKVKGGNHLGDWLLYLSPENVEFELRYQAAFRANAKYHEEKLAILKEMVLFQTQLVDGRRQQVVPHLRGVPTAEVLKYLYGGITGKQRPVPEDPDKYMAGFLPYKSYSKYKPGDDIVRKTLVRELAAFREAEKAYNVAKTELSQTTDKNEKRDKERILDSEADSLERSKASVLSAEGSGTHPTVETAKVFEVAIDPNKPFEKLK